jgi:hypothetical protein
VHAVSLRLVATRYRYRLRITFAEVNQSTFN